MACFSPLQAFNGRGVTASGKRPKVFRFARSRLDGEVFDLPCGKCEGCMLERSRQWAIRATHEASLWKENVFVTLTYSPEFLPVVGSVPTLRPRDFVLFMKRLRKAREPEVVRFLQAGEYGSSGRPHHHVLLFNCGFPDAVVFREKSCTRARLFRSAELEGLWPLGFSSFGEVTFESAAYVARYTLKKVVSVVSEVRPDGVRADVPVQVLSREAEYMTMSRRPGIGAGWFEKWKGDVFPSDEVVLRGGRVMRPPRFYFQRLEKEDPEAFAKVKARRESIPDKDSYVVVVNGKLHTRLMAKREALRLRLAQQKREL